MFSLSVVGVVVSYVAWGVPRARGKPSFLCQFDSSSQDAKTDKSPLTAVAVSPNGNTICALHEKIINLFDSSGLLLSSTPHPDTCYCVAFNATGERFFVTHDSKFTVHDVSCKHAVFQTYGKA